MYKRDLRNSSRRHARSRFNDPLVVALGIAFLCIVFSLKRTFGLSNATIANDDWAVLLTFMFAHENIGHLLINLAGLILAGVLGKEIGLSGLKFMLIFFAGGFAVAPMFLIPNSYVFMGASVGICGILGAEAIELGRYGLSSGKLFLIFALALVADSVVNVLFVVPTVAVDALVHLTALTLGSVLIIIYRSISAVEI
jgi:membrane associated rhomboid family serine protease